jgi:predicted acetyltransferase
MELEMRPVNEDELPAFVRCFEAAFGNDAAQEEVDHWVGATDASRTLAVFDGGEIVGTAGAWEMEQTLPGLTSIPVAGVTAVGVLPTHRRRGLLTRMMDRQLDDCLARGESVAILTASEAIIYGRFGYGWATTLADASVDANHGAFSVPVHDDGRIRRIDKETVKKVAPGLHERVRRQTPGDVSLPPSFWDLFLLDLERHRDGGGPLFYYVHESAGGEPDGFLSYRYKQKWTQGNPASTAMVADLFAETPEVEAALFRFLLDLDLIASVQFNNRPLDDHLQRRLANPRRYAVGGASDHVWVRLVDLVGALSARRYSADGSVVFDVTDRFRPATTGRYLVEGGPEGAVCTHTTEPADIAVTVDSLGAAYLGGVSFGALARAGRAEELRPGALRRADAMFLTDPAPYCRSGF